jgi:hypothetical protein
MGDPPAFPEIPEIDLGYFTEVHENATVYYRIRTRIA